MKTVTKYKANDGQEFNTENEATAHEKLLARLKSLEGRLFPTPENDGCHFANGHGFVQQDSDVVREYKRELLLLAAERNPSCKFAEWAKVPDEVRPMSGVGRILCDADSLLYRYWHRLMCMDEQCQEWGQPFFAINPWKGEHKKLN